MKKSVLNKRFLREFKSDFGKYLVIFLLMVISIGEVSGFLVADESLIKAYDESFEKYNIEDGNLETDEILNQDKVDEINNLGIKLYENFAKEITFKLNSEKNNELKIRIFKERENINLLCLMDGKLPENNNEIAIDRMVADNNNLKIGDILKNEEETYKITGLVALSDYSTMFENNNDMMFDSLKFGVAVVTADEFNTYSNLRYIYSYKYTEKSSKNENDRATDLLNEITKKIQLKNYIPRHENQAITFTGDDMNGDKAMMSIFLYIITAIIAFVFVINIKNTIIKESEVIGTLRATGYTKGEIIRHYMAMPIIVTFISAITGNILGYTAMKNFNAKLYYSSYSLPTYVTIWSISAFIETTLVPIVIMIVITYVSIRRKLSFLPIKFLTGDLTGNKNFSIKLNKKIPFFTRFKLRVIFQNFGNYIMLFVGVSFAYFMLMYGMMMPELLDDFSKNISKNMFTENQYFLKVPTDVSNDEMELLSTALKTDNKSAEKFSAYRLRTLGDISKEEDIIVYGVSNSSKYIKLSEGDGVTISKNFAEKFELNIGDKFKLKEKYKNKEYEFKVDNINEYQGSLCIFMKQKRLNKTFNLPEKYFSGYFADKKILDIDKKYIATVIGFDDLSKTSRQLKISMGGIMNIVNVFAVIVFLIIIYLLTKTIIEKNAAAISMAKIMGYTAGEINRIYLGATTIAMLFCLIVSMPIQAKFLIMLVKNVLRKEMSGWLPIYITFDVEVKMFITGLCSYLVILAFEYGKVRKIPLEEALKNDE